MAHQCFKLLSRKKNDVLLRFTRSVSGQTVNSPPSEGIIIPKRIPRSQTDILMALSSTVGMDPTAPAYKYIDDPFLIPNNRHQKMVYALSKESGRKAAKFFMSKFPQYFMRDEAEPKVEALHFKELFDESMDLTEEDLQCAIENNQVDNAITAYKTIKSKEGKLSDDVKENLLELICYFNSIEAPDPDLREKFISEKNLDSLWVADLAFDILDSLEHKDGKSFSIMIAGLCKNSAHERALQLYHTSREKNIPLTVEAYNGLISTCTRGQSFENRWSAVMGFVEEMNVNKVAPNLTTFVNIFDILVRCKTTGEVREKARGLMKEMKRCKVEPSLAIYNDLLRIYTNGNNVRPRILEEILEDLENKELVMRHEKDNVFFSTAMAICFNVLSDIQLAYKLHDIVTSHRNYLLLGSTDSESRYYNNFFRLIVKSEPIDKTMEIYYKYIPNHYVPDTSTLIELVEATELYQADRYIPQICSDFILFEYVYSSLGTKKLLEILSRREYPKEIQDHVNSTVSEILRFIESRAVNPRSNAETQNFDVAIFDSCLKIFTISKDITKAKKVLDLLIQLKKSINGQPSFQVMRDFIDMVIVHGTGKDLVVVVKTACAYGDASVISKAIHVCEKRKASQNLINILDEIRSKHGIAVQNFSESSDSSDSSSDSSDDENLSKAPKIQNNEGKS